uniref:DNA-directed RNA polymerase subunit alpha n=1 Tax=Palmophyllum crassum TaxID=1615899 RepID=A0A1L7NXX2_9VIRI|nr:RNA polymerase alpha subunit [Palmophyllum crassum]BAW34767.1 RNA polymerase alpha subunit [Palmophyllum crassum]
MKNSVIDNFHIYCLESKKESRRSLYGRFRIGPLLKGQGLTIGNALRRVLLENIETIGVTILKIPNITHEFSTISGIRESILDIILNIKKLVFKGNIINSNKCFLKSQGPSLVTAANIECPQGIQIVDSSQYIMTISSNMEFSFDLTLESNSGYFENSELLISPFCFPIDFVFMPVTKVNYKIQYYSVNEFQKYEYIFFEIWTNGSIEPTVALQKAAKKIIEILEPISNLQKKTIKLSESQSEFQLNQIHIEQLELSARSFNCLKRAKILTLADLLKYTKQDLLEIKNFGEKSADEVVHAVDQILKQIKYQLKRKDYDSSIKQ